MFNHIFHLREWEVHYWMMLKVHVRPLSDWNGIIIPTERTNMIHYIPFVDRPALLTGKSLMFIPFQEAVTYRTTSWIMGPVLNNYLAQTMLNVPKCKQHHPLSPTVPKDPPPYPLQPLKTSWKSKGTLPQKKSTPPFRSGNIRALIKRTIDHHHFSRCQATAALSFFG